MLTKRVFLVVTVTIMIVMCAGCTEDRTYHKLTGLWEGQNTNNVTGKTWNFKLVVEHRGSDISAIYSDYRGARTLRNISYDGDQIGFLIDLWPEAVTYYGAVDSKSSMSGTWSYSGDGNNGTWYLLKNRDPEDEDNDPDDPSAYFF
jgi:heme/copper-type cytochrome/quinol oxidase subunit 2